MDLLDRLQNLGVDTVHSLERFGNNQALYERFLKKFPADPNFGGLKEAMNAGNFQEALTAAHTLKGVSANLGMDQLSKSCAALVSRLRAGETDGFEELLAELQKDYESIVAALGES